jgi:multiple sugar transport system permease protein
VIIGLPAAYALARMEFRGKEDLAFSFLSLRFAPELIILLPLFVIYQSFGLYDTYIG